MGRKRRPTPLVASLGTLLDKGYPYEKLGLLAVNFAAYQRGAIDVSRLLQKNPHTPERKLRTIKRPYILHMRELFFQLAHGKEEPELEDYFSALVSLSGNASPEEVTGRLIGERSQLIYILEHRAAMPYSESIEGQIFLHLNDKDMSFYQFGMAVHQGAKEYGSRRSPEVYFKEYNCIRKALGGLPLPADRA